MAVKVMVAPAIAARDVASRDQKSREPRPAKPRRRRSAVYDADGHEVLITLMCLKCHKMRPLSQFGLRRMADGSIRNQPWCRTCRSSAGAERPRQQSEAEIPVEVPVEGPPEPAQKPVAAGIVAAQVAAALAAGWAK